MGAWDFKGPPGIMVKNYKLGKEMDQFEYIELPKSGEQNLDGPYSWVVGGPSRTWKRHYWIKTVKSGGQEVMIAAGLNLKTRLPIDFKEEAKTEALMDDLVESLKLA